VHSVAGGASKKIWLRDEREVDEVLRSGGRRIACSSIVPEDGRRGGE
jgi:hypothetical protein